MSNLSETLPVIDLDVFLSEEESSERVQEECKKVSLVILRQAPAWAHEITSHRLPSL
jgi:hypothetical protein